MDNKPLVLLFTDGACKRPGHPGGWAYLLRFPATGHERATYGCDDSTTNNRMELQAVLEGIKGLLLPCQVILVSDSEYVVNGISTWRFKWRKNGWKRGLGIHEVKNRDQWEELDKMLAKHDITCRHVRGHIGHPENEFCDKWAGIAADQLVSGSIVPATPTDIVSQALNAEVENVKSGVTDG